EGFASTVALVGPGAGGEIQDARDGVPRARILADRIAEHPEAVRREEFHQLGAEGGAAGEVVRNALDPGMLVKDEMDDAALAVAFASNAVAGRRVGRRGNAAVRRSRSDDCGGDEKRRE